MKGVGQGPYRHETQNQPSLWMWQTKWPSRSSVLVFGSPVKSRGLDSTILVGPFQIKIFCSVLWTRGDANSGNLYLCSNTFS